jgi:hypothetical protein
MCQEYASFYPYSYSLLKFLFKSHLSSEIITFHSTENSSDAPTSPLSYNFLQITVKIMNDLRL